jgi:serine/threonine protein kinase
MARTASAITRFLERPDAERRLGPFLLLRQLGHGGFAPVWLAREVYGGTELRAAAVKLFALDRGRDAPLGEGSGGPSSDRERILEEARSLCRVEHPSVVRFYALSIDEQAGVMGLAMEHVAGTPLDERIARAGKLAVAETLAVGIAIASALSAVHRAGLVHRDVKPANVIDAAGVYKLIDFGIAAADAVASRDDAQEGAPVSGTIEVDPIGNTRPIALFAGTIGYIDPACFATGAPASPASDLYSLGATLFECLTGEVPAIAAGELRDHVLGGRVAPPKVAEVAPGVPPSLARVVDALVQPDRRLRPSSAEEVASLLEQARSEIAGARRALPPESEGPFRGLARFEERDRGVYFGRHHEVAAALDALRTRGLTALVGSSGSGKSSLARAGVVPAVADGALGGWPKAWDAIVAEPGSDPRAAIGALLSPFVRGAASREPDDLVEALAARARETGRGTLIFVDQLEELATLAAGESRAWTAALLGRLGEISPPGVRALVTARRDLLDPLLAISALGRSLVKGLVLIEPISDLAWSDVLDQALAAYGYTFEDDALRADLLAELEGTAGAMPLVQFALGELWQKRDPAAKRITRAGLAAIGGVAGALERHADATFEAIPPGEREAAKGALLALTTPQGTRATKSREELAAIGASDAVLAIFERARLVVPGERGLTLAHEALLTRWGKLRAWVAEARDDRQLADELERDAALRRADPEGAPLWQRRRLAFGEELRRRGTVRLSPDALAFLQASRWAARRAQIAIFGSILVAGVSLLGLGIAYVRAVEERESAVRGSLVKVEDALGKEQVSRRAADESRREAERRADELRRKQAEIDALLRKLDEAEDRETRQKIKEQLRRRMPAAPAAAPAPAPPPTSSAIARHPDPAPPSQAAPAVAPAEPAPPVATSFNP